MLSVAHEQCKTGHEKKKKKKTNAVVIAFYHFIFLFSCYTSGKLNYRVECEVHYC